LSDELGVITIRQRPLNPAAVLAIISLLTGFPLSMSITTRISGNEDVINMLSAIEVYHSDNDPHEKRRLSPNPLYRNVIQPFSITPFQSCYLYEYSINIIGS